MITDFFFDKEIGGDNIHDGAAPDSLQEEDNAEVEACVLSESDEEEEEGFEFFFFSFSKKSSEKKQFF